MLQANKHHAIKQDTLIDFICDFMEADSGMDIDPGFIVVVGAVLIFYLRLIVIQRQRARRARQAPATLSRPAPRSKAGVRSGAASQKQTSTGQKKSTRSNQPAAFEMEQYSILSPRRSDRIIGAVGLVLLLVGMILFAGILPALQPYWWVPAAIGIIAFSWAFKL